MAGYGTDAGFTAYAVARGYVVPAGSVPAARERGSGYIDAVYGYRFSGTPVGGIEQDRAWPRDDAEDIYGNAISASAIPTRVINASYEATYLELVTPGSLAILISDNERLKRIKAGSVEIEYAGGGSASAIDGAIMMSSIIDGLLYPLIGTTLLLPAMLIV